MIIENKSYTGEDIENLNSIASDHLFMHAMQTNDWKKSGLQMYKDGQGCWVTDLEDNKFLDMMGGLWYKSSGYGQQEIADAAYKQLSELSSPPAYSTTPSTVKLSGEIASLYQDKKCRTFFTSGGSESVETAVKMAKKYYETEASGNITLKTVKNISKTGVNRISVGSITHSAPALDLKLEI